MLSNFDELHYIIYAQPRALSSPFCYFIYFISMPMRAGFTRDNDASDFSISSVSPFIVSALGDAEINGQRNYIGIDLDDDGLRDGDSQPPCQISQAVMIILFIFRRDWRRRFWHYYDDGRHAVQNAKCHYLAFLAASHYMSMPLSPMLHSASLSYAIEEPLLGQLALTA